MRLPMMAVVCAKAARQEQYGERGVGRYRLPIDGQRDVPDQEWLVSHIHRKKPKGRAMPETMRRANNAKSKIRARVEHVFAEQKHRMGLFIRTIGIARATTKIGMANLVCNIKRLIYLRNLAIA